MKKINPNELSLEEREKREKKLEYNREYYKKNKESLKAKKKKYSDMTEEEKERKHQKDKEYYRKNSEKVKKRVKEYAKNNAEKCSTQSKEYYKSNKDKISEKARNKNKEYREIVYNILGKKCAICGEDDERTLTLDHKKDDGKFDREVNGKIQKQLIKLKIAGWPEDLIKSKYQVLCWNHNITKGGRRDYLEKSNSEIIPRHRRLKDLWSDAYKFFGPCEICGCNELKFLTLDHKDNSGAEERGNGKGTITLLREFQKLNWPEFIKEKYRFLCYNCNSGRRVFDILSEKYSSPEGVSSHA